MNSTVTAFFFTNTIIKRTGTFQTNTKIFLFNKNEHNFISSFLVVRHPPSCLPFHPMKERYLKNGILQELLLPTLKV